MVTALLWCFATRHSTQVMALVLVKCCNAVAGHHSIAQRVGLSASMAVLHLLLRTKAIDCEACLALNADRPTVTINITLLEYQCEAQSPMLTLADTALVQRDATTRMMYAKAHRHDAEGKLTRAVGQRNASIGTGIQTIVLAEQGIVVRLSLLLPITYL